MKLSQYLSTSLAAGAFLLAGSFVLAQTTTAARNMQPRDTASGQSSGMQTQPGSAPGMAVNERGSRGHNGTTMQSIAVDHAGGNGVRRADTGKSGSNPMYEGKGQANLKPNTGASAVEYKDPEDMTTRYRPGNNKTTHIANDAAAQGADAAQPQSTPKKHIAGVKYEDRVAGNNPDGTAGQSTHDVVQRKSASIVLLNDKGTERTDRNSAHATESLRTSDKAKTGENPLYEEGGKSGTNPLFESGKRQSAATSGNPSPSPEAQRPKRPGKTKYVNVHIW